MKMRHDVELTPRPVKKLVAGVALVAVVATASSTTAPLVAKCGARHDALREATLTR